MRTIPVQPYARPGMKGPGVSQSMLRPTLMIWFQPTTYHCMQSPPCPSCQPFPRTCLLQTIQGRASVDQPSDVHAGGVMGGGPGDDGGGFPERSASRSSTWIAEMAANLRSPSEAGLFRRRPDSSDGASSRRRGYDDDDDEDGPEGEWEGQVTCWSGNAAWRYNPGVGVVDVGVVEDSP